MKTILHFLFIQFFLIIFVNSSYAQWKPVKTLTGGSVLDLAKDGNNIFALVENYGVVKSNDNGNNWTLIFNQNANYIQSHDKFSVDKNQIVLSANYSEYSNDTGATWQTLSMPTSIHAAVVIGGNIVLAGDSIYVSHDDGNTWIGKLPSNQNFFYSLIKSGNKLFASDINTYVSSDSGVTWSYFSPFPLGFNPVFTSKGDTVVELISQAIRYTTNFGVTWNVNPVPFFSIYPYEALCFVDDSLFYINSDSVFWSLDLGTTWNYVSHKKDLYSTCMIKTDSNLLIGSSYFGIIKTDVSSGIMTAQNNNINAVSVRNLVAKGDTIIAATQYSIIYFSHDNGSTWTSYPFDRNVTSITAHGDDFYISTSDQIFISINGGASFDSLTFLNGCSKIFEMKIKDSTMYCATDIGVYAVSTLTGANNKIGNLLSSLSIAIFDSIIYSVDKYHVYKSNLNVVPNWVDISPPVSVVHIGWGYVSSNDTAIYLSGRNKGVYRLFPPSTTWTYTGLHDKNSGRVIFNKNNDAFCISQKGVVEFRDYPGAKWDPINYNLPKPFTGTPITLACNDSNIFLGAINYPNLGLWKRSLSQLAIAAGANEIESEENDFIIYPNPVADLINLELPSNIIGRNISVEIFSEDGKQILNEQKTLSQQNKLQLNVSKLSPGFYIVKIISGENQLNGSFVKMKN